MNIKKNIKGLQHIGIPTDNIAKTIDFYQSLGFETVYKTYNESADEKVAFLQLGNLVIETYENRAAEMRKGAIDHIALDVTDIDRVFKEIQANGYKMLDSAVQSLPFWEYGVRFFTIAGTNEEKIEFCEKIKTDKPNHK
jgi:catechol 2,3-dioxygenase-like lactoylglutathione lyase family enzyme